MCLSAPLNLKARAAESGSTSGSGLKELPPSLPETQDVAMDAEQAEPPAEELATAMSDRALETY